MTMIRSILTAGLSLSLLTSAQAAQIKRLPAQSARPDVGAIGLGARIAGHSSRAAAGRMPSAAVSQGARALAAEPARPGKESLRARIRKIQKTVSQASKKGDAAKLSRELAALYYEGGHPLPTSDTVIGIPSVGSGPVSAGGPSKAWAAKAAKAFAKRYTEGYPSSPEFIPTAGSRVKRKDEVHLPAAVSRALRIRDDYDSKPAAYRLPLLGTVVYAVYSYNLLQMDVQQLSLFTQSGRLFAVGTADAMGIGGWSITPALVVEGGGLSRRTPETDPDAISQKPDANPSKKKPAALDEKLVRAVKGDFETRYYAGELGRMSIPSGYKLGAKKRAALPASVRQALEKREGASRPIAYELDLAGESVYAVTYRVGQNDIVSLFTKSGKFIARGNDDGPFGILWN